jgi:hypothetical protein
MNWQYWNCFIAATRANLNFEPDLVGQMRLGSAEDRRWTPRSDTVMIYASKRIFLLYFREVTLSIVSPSRQQAVSEGGDCRA